ncbi:MAG TPA: zinc-ribbon domain-containing protein [Candidatus Limnocylindrales bacterium]
MIDYPNSGALCSNCGTQLISGAKFCVVCGQTVPDAPAPQTAAWAPTTPIVAPVEPAPADVPVWAPMDVPPAPPIESVQPPPYAPAPYASAPYASAPPAAYWQQPSPYAPPAYGQPPIAPAYPGFGPTAPAARRNVPPIAIALLIVGLALILVACGLFVLAS